MNLWTFHIVWINGKLQPSNKYDCDSNDPELGSLFEKCRTEFISWSESHIYEIVVKLKMTQACMFGKFHFFVSCFGCWLCVSSENRKIRMKFSNLWNTFFLWIFNSSGEGKSEKRNEWNEWQGQGNGKKKEIKAELNRTELNWIWVTVKIFR